LKVGATRKIKLLHVGKYRFSNASSWGSDYFDSTFVPESILPVKDRDGFEFPRDVDGWLLPEEGKALYELAKDKRVLEIGSYCGKSTICLAKSAKLVVSVDPHDGRGTPRPKNTLAEFISNLERYGVRDKVTALLSISKVDSEFDIVFIDGAHDADSVEADIQHAVNHLSPNGLIVFHDYREFPGQYDGGWDPGVNESVDDFISDGAELLTTYATLAVVRPPAAILEEA
jgi:predicted O-methyltransferase YrrM